VPVRLQRSIVSRITCNLNLVFGFKHKGQMSTDVRYYFVDIWTCSSMCCESASDKNLNTQSCVFQLYLYINLWFQPVFVTGGIMSGGLWRDALTMHTHCSISVSSTASEIASFCPGYNLPNNTLNSPCRKRRKMFSFYNVLVDLAFL